MGKGVANQAAKIKAVIMSDCQVVLDLYISDVCVQCVTRERQYSGTQHRHVMGFTEGIILKVSLE